MLASPLKPWPLIALLLAAPAVAQDEPADDATEAPTTAPEAAQPEATAPEAPEAEAAQPQATQPPSTQPAAPGEAQAPSAGGGGLALGEAAEPAVGQVYALETFTDWEVRCERTAAGPDLCQLYQLLQDEQGNSVAEITIYDLPAGREAAAGVNVITPLETQLTEQVAVSVDGAQPKSYPFAFCTAIGCISRFGLTDEDLAAYRRGSDATITIVPALAPDETVNLRVSLAGFTAGFDALSSQGAAPAGDQ